MPFQGSAVAMAPGSFYHASMLAATELMPTVIGFVFLAIAVLVILLALRTRRRAQDSQTWPRIPGHVVKSWVGTRRRQKGRVHYYVGVEYTYRVADRDYTSNRVGFGSQPMFGSRSSAESAAKARYPEGMNLNVYYDPRNHAKAVLDRKPPTLWAATTAAMVFAGMGVFILIGKF